MSKRFYIIGAGLGTREFLTGYAVEKLNEAGLVLAAPRLASLRMDALPCPYTQLAQRAEESDEECIALLVSGDVGFFSVAHTLRERLKAYGEVELVCGVSSMQYFCAKVGMPYDNVCVRSLHGRDAGVLGAVSYNRFVFLLTGGRHNAASVCGELAKAGLGRLTVHLGEKLGSCSERIETDRAEKLAGKPCGDLTVLLIENPCAVNNLEPLRDDMFIRSEHVPMTKEEVRWASANKLGVRPRDTVWDIGAGTGGMSLELARRAADGTVYAVERSHKAVSVLEENRVKLGGYNVRIIRGEAPDALENLPDPDCVFIGGSGGGLKEIMSIVKARNPSAGVVVNAVTLETLNSAQSAFIELGYGSPEVTQLAVTKGRECGSYTMLCANNPVFILSGRCLHNDLR